MFERHVLLCASRCGVLRGLVGRGDRVLTHARLLMSWRLDCKSCNQLESIAP